MKDSIPSSAIYNRKLIIEIRYDPTPKIVDLRGKILDELLKAKVIPNAIWELGDGIVSLADGKSNEYTKKCTVDTQRLYLISVANHTNESFFHCFQTIFDKVSNMLEFDITRIGCRIQGSYKTKSTTFPDILNKFATIFPSDYFLDSFSPKNLHFQLNYQNGQYVIGPIEEKDKWVEQQFHNEKVRVDKAGFGIDTDNFIIKDKKEDTIKPSSIKDVYMASLSVEKLLFDKLNTF